MITETDRRHLARCVELAHEGVAQGHKPFGALLIDKNGDVLKEDFNRTGSGDVTAHPELALVQWASLNLSDEDCAAATVYASCEHCPMCATGHAFAGLGRIVFAISAEQIDGWFKEFGSDTFPFKLVTVRELLPDLAVSGPDETFVDEMHALFKQVFAS